MSVEFKTWNYIEAQRDKFSTWMKGVSTGHTGTKDVRNQQVNWHPLEKPLSECTVALVTTGGVHLRDQEPFDMQNPHGDWSYRTFGMDVDVKDLMVTHSHYNHGDADLDINCMLPIQRLQELAERGVVGGCNPTVYSFMGFVPDPQHLVEETGLEVAQRLKSEAPDLVLLTGG